MVQTPETLFSATRHLREPAAGLHRWGTAQTFMFKDCMNPQTGQITLGRDRCVEIVFDSEDDRTISLIHALIEPADDKTMSIQDKDSTNGTYVNGTLAAGPEPIYVGTCIRLGKKLRLVGVDADQLTPVAIRLVGEFSYMAFLMYGSWREAERRLDVKREFLRARGQAWQNEHIKGIVDGSH